MRAKPVPIARTSKGEDAKSQHPRPDLEQQAHVDHHADGDEKNAAEHVPHPGKCFFDPVFLGHIGNGGAQKKGAKRQGVAGFDGEQSHQKKQSGDDNGLQLGIGFGFQAA